jgi:uncharacterized membrane protein
MNEKNKVSGQKWWMGWLAFFRIISGAALVVLIWLILALKLGTDVDDVTASGSVSPRMIAKSAALFGGLVVLAFLVFWTRLLLAWLFLRIWGLLRWLFSWRMIRRYLYGLAGVALVVALFYAEEDWRGKRDWEQYKRAAEAKGERFDLSSFAPPAVPDDQISHLCRLSPIVVCSAWFGTSKGLKKQAPTPGLVWRSGSMPTTTGSPGPPMISRATGNVGRELI